jgi:phosphate transport system substrate-binding protein
VINSHSKRLGGIALAATLLAAACTSPGATTTPTAPATGAPSTTAPETMAPLSGDITIDGSSTVYPITEAVAEEFQIANSGVQVAVAFSGTGGGFKKFCIGETDINDASRPIKEADEGEGVACETNDIQWVELQVAIDGLSVVVNHDADFIDCLTVEQLNQIFGPDSPKNITWQDIDASWPAEQINRFIPGADSGTFDYFTEEISGEVDASTTFATQSEDDNTLVTGIAGDSYAIGYFGFAYYVENTDKLKALAVDGGSGCVAPTDETINSNEYAPLSRPIFIYPDVAKAKERPELKAFVDFYLANTQVLSSEVGYVALPNDLLATEIAEWEAAVGG